jgi:hypothetical protein
MVVDKPGIYAAMTADEYHADPAPVPSLSAGVACALVHDTPLHALLKHDRLRRLLQEKLGGDDAPEDDFESNGASRFGTVAHELLLGRGSGIHVMQTVYDEKHDKAGQRVTDYKTKAAQKEKADIEALGHVCCFQHELDRAEELVDLILEGVREVPGCERAFHPEHGRSEVAVFWTEEHLRAQGQPVWGRCLVDWWGEDGHLYDLKTTGRDLSDEALMRKIDQDNLDMRAAWYLRGTGMVVPLLRGRMDYRLVFVQQKPPYELRVVVLDNATILSGMKKVAFALDKWAYHLGRDYWPGYPKRIEIMSAPKWATIRWDEREEEEPRIKTAILNDPVLSTETTPSRDLLELKEIAS